MANVIDYGLGITTMAQTNLLKLFRVQNEAMRIILGTTKDTSTETMRFMLDLPQMHTRQKVEQVKAYFTAVENPHNPLNEAVKDTKGCKLGRGKSWMGQAEDSVLQICLLTELKQTKEWERYPNRFRRLSETLLPENVGKHCRERPAGKTEIKLLSQQTAIPHNITLMASHQRPVRVGLHRHARCDYHP